MTDYSNDIRRYRSGEMSRAERHALEKKALDDPFLAEALEGAEMLPANEFAGDMEELGEKIRDAGKSDKRSTISIWTWSYRIAAGVVILLTSAYLIWNLSQPVSDEPIAMKSAETPDGRSEASPEDTVSAEELRHEEDEDSAPTTYPTPLSARAEGKRDALPPEKLRDTQPDIVTEETKVEADLAQAQPQATAPLRIETKATEVVEAETEARAKRAADEAPAARKEVSRVAGAAVSVQHVVHGKITSLEDGSPIPGVNVIIKGSSIGTISDASGNYQVEAPAANPTLVFSFIGYRSTEIATDDRKEVNVQLGSDATSLSEVVVVGSSAAVGERIPITVELAHPEPGNRAFKQYLERNIRYPQEAIAQKVSGRVTIEFTIEEDGDLSEFNVVRGIGAGCDEELIRLVKEGPRWIPTKTNGTPVRDKARVRLKFDLPK